MFFILYAALLETLQVLLLKAYLIHPTRRLWKRKFLHLAEGFADGSIPDDQGVIVRVAVIADL